MNHVLTNERIRAVGPLPVATEIPQIGCWS